MKVVVDLDLHEAIQDFTIKAAASVYQFKSQDTVNWMIYFVRDGVVQDLGPAMAIKFGMIATGDATNTLLAYQTTFSYLTDANSNVFYECTVNFNTSQMATAMTGKSSLPCTAEIRYQTADSEIIHSLNISCVVYPTILVETGVTPPGVSTGYPDASTLVLKTTISQPNGVAGLDSSGHIISGQIPVDTQTVIIDPNGKIAAGSIITYTAANFTCPTVNSTIGITVVSTAGLHVNQFVRIPIAGFYQVTLITDTTHCTIQNVGDPLNAVGATIISGAALLPAQAVSSGGGGGTGTGQSAFTQTTATFTVPAVGAIVTLTVGDTSWMGGNGFYVFITGAGYYAISSIVDSQHVVVTNTGTASNSPTRTIVPAPATIAAAGPPGAAGAAGVVLSAYDTIAVNFTMPAANANVTISINNTAWLGVGQIIYIAGAGYFSVSAISSATQVSITNLNYIGNASAGSSITAGANVSPGGLQGPQGAGGAGLNAFTTLSTSFIQPAIGASVSVNVGSTAWIADGMVVYIQGGGYYQVASVPDLTHVSCTNLGYVGNVSPGTTVATGTGVEVTPGGLAGASGNAFTTTTAAFVMPTTGSTVNVTVGSTAWMAQGQTIFIPSAGYFQVTTVSDSTHVILTNPGTFGNANAGSSFPSGSQVSPAGVQGPSGTGGGGGVTALTDATSTGSSVINSSSGVLKRFVGAGGATVTDTGTTVTISSATGGGTVPPESMGALVETPTVKTYLIDLAASSTYTIQKLLLILAAGTATVSLLVNGSPVSGATGLSVTTTLLTTTLTTAISVNNKVQLQVTAVSGATDLQFSVWIQR